MIEHIIRLQKSGLSHVQEAQLDTIFFQSSGTQTFASPAIRAEFRDRWLGSYLTENPNEVFLATVSHGTEVQIVGYVIGALADPALAPRYAHLGYFQTFARWTALYPAHLHINVASQHRSSGIGARLIESFAVHARASGAPGVHVVTGKGLRNVGFYLRNGFVELAEAPWNNTTVVMLGRKLG